MATSKLTVPILLEWKDIEAYMELYDIVEVVRCKDCRKWCICHHSDDYFCADGERREDGNNG